MKVINTEKIPIKLWLEDIEEGALKQARNLANLPYAFKWIAIMPDVHQGYGMPIGGIMATKGVIVPNAVGVDIGCGMCVVKTSLIEIDVTTFKKIVGEIRRVIPLGFNRHKADNSENGRLMPQSEVVGDNKYIVNMEWNNALTQIGTLGGGNHFIEIQKGSDGHIWIMIHSGSRNLGFKIANHYNKLAIELNEKWKSSVPKSWELTFLPIDSKEGQNYLKEMNYCVEFALANRNLMMQRVLESFYEILIKQDKTMSNEPMINIAHNYASLENHFGQNVWVHRKGATKATKGLIGIVPGSQGANSYIVEGLGNPESFMSCSHGAGRKMGRKEARRTLNLEEEQKKMEGVIHGLRNEKNLDEAPGSYKDINKVMANQANLIEIKVELKPLASIKG